jgi:putative PIN family toxin of toxin-antitoxin system
MKNELVKVVADTNTIISGMLWHGAPHTLLEIAYRNEIKLLTCSALLQELTEVLQRDKFIPYLSRARMIVRELVEGYSLMAQVIELGKIEPVIAADPDDDVVLACAVTGRAKIIISGDNHLLSLEQYQQIQIMTASEFLSKTNFY